MKCCTSCNQTKSIELFPKDPSCKGGYRAQCRDCKNAKRRAWYQADPEARREQIYKYRQEHPDRVKQSKAEYYQRHKDKVDEQILAWRRANPQVIKAYQQTNYHRHKDQYYAKSAKRRALEKQAVPPWAELDKIKTVYSKAMEYNFEVDHIVPLQSELVCGLHCWANLQLLDRTINRSKGNRSWPDMP